MNKKWKSTSPRDERERLVVASGSFRTRFGLVRSWCERNEVEREIAENAGESTLKMFRRKSVVGVKVWAVPKTGRMKIGGLKINTV